MKTKTKRIKPKPVFVVNPGGFATTQLGDLLMTLHSRGGQGFNVFQSKNGKVITVKQAKR